MIEVVGMGDGGFVDLPESTQRLVRDAAVLLGGERHLALVPPIDGQRRMPWPRPLRAGLADLLSGLAEAGGPVVALASGDPLRSGIGTTLIAELGADAVRIHPHVSSVALARARMGWSAESVEVITTVGRSVAPVRRALAPRQRVIVLCSDGAGPAQIAHLLRESGCGTAQLTALWHLGGAAEGSRSATAQAWSDEPTPELVVLCIEVADLADSATMGPAPGRPEQAYEHDGQISKRDVRASAVAHLRPAAGAHLWDLGAGSGSVGIEWALAAPRASVTSVERDPERAARIERNAEALGVPDQVSVVVAVNDEVESALVERPDPDAVFVGGGLSTHVLDVAWSRLRPGGRFVAHAVTLGTEALLIEAYGRFGGELTRISVETAVPLGRHLSWTPARPVVQWSATKGQA